MNVIATFSLLLGVALCDLNVAKSKECGELTCGFAEFCSPIDGSCKHCSKICNEGHNQQILMCNEHCQDYIHDMRYVKRGENSGDNYHYNNEQIQKLQVVSIISLIVSLIVFACLVFLILTLWLNKKTKFNVFKLVSQMKKKKEKPDITRNDDLCQINSTEISTIRVPGERVLNMREINEAAHNRPRETEIDYSTLTTTFKNHHARLEVDSISSACTNKTNRTTQPLAVRLPSEDSTLDFMYDNPALAPSPTIDNKETNGGDGKKVSSNVT